MLRNILTSIIALGALQCSAQYTKLVDFIGMPNGEYPYGDLIHDGTHLYGMTRTGGQENMGNIFRVRTDGSDFSNVFQFSAPGATGIYPNGSLITDGTFLYGMTAMEGATGFTGKGTIFKVAKDGTGYTKLHDFTGYPDGGNPFGSLLLMGSTLYGMTQYGGNEDLGTIFKVNTDGTGYTKLRDLTFGPTNGGYGPWGTLITDGTRLYGMMAAGGIQNCCGTVFSMLYRLFSAAHIRHQRWRTGWPTGRTAARGRSALWHDALWRGQQCGHGVPSRHRRHRIQHAVGV
jgi:uncharacterized repeat protein (TIGR03803 family)